MKEQQALIEYVKNWQSIDGFKPQNEPIFYTEFLKLITDYPDDREVEFNGDGSYFGKQVTLLPFSLYGKSPKELQFEVSYSKDKISVYSANHHGFWCPEYLCMDKDTPDFMFLSFELTKFLKRVFGL